MFLNFKEISSNVSIKASSMRSAECASGKTKTHQLFQFPVQNYKPQD